MPSTTSRNVLITGAAGAIGRGIAAGFLAQNDRVFLTDLDQASLDRQAGTLSADPLSCHTLAADVSNAEQVAAVTRAALAAFDGAIDVLVNVAGVVGQGRVEELSESEWDRMFDVNVKGTFLFIREIVPAMKTRRSGKIINFSSKSGKTGSALMSHYSSAKAAIIGLTQALAYELADAGITVNCLCPGITDHTGVWAHVSSGYIQNLGLPREDVVRQFTAKVPLKRLASIDDVVAVTLFLASSGADYMTGQAINVTGGREMH
jgi:NAD(P)-dependent dehydrogenase (short-subunit alcohol dehydrogenase family)